jgi:hypothetical protein
MVWKNGERFFGAKKITELSSIKKTYLTQMDTDKKYDLHR